MAEHANHPHNLTAMHCGMFEHMPQNFPAREAPLDFAGKLQHQFDLQAGLRQLFQPASKAFPEFRPVLPQVSERVLRGHTLGQSPGSQVGSRAQAIEPDSFAIIDMAKRAENAGVRDAKVALEFLSRESRAALEQAMIGPCGAADVGEEQRFGEGHGESIYGRNERGRRGSGLNPAGSTSCGPSITIQPGKNSMSTDVIQGWGNFFAGELSAALVEIRR